MMGLFSIGTLTVTPGTNLGTQRYTVGCLRVKWILNIYWFPFSSASYAPKMKLQNPQSIDSD